MFAIKVFRRAAANLGVGKRRLIMETDALMHAWSSKQMTSGHLGCNARRIGVLVEELKLLARVK